MTCKTGCTWERCDPPGMTDVEMRRCTTCDQRSWRQLPPWRPVEEDRRPWWVWEMDAEAPYKPL